MERKTFFFAVRATLFNGTMTQAQVDGIEAILNEAERERIIDTQTAYILATPYRETDKTFQPIDEYGGPSYFTKMYDVTGDYPDRARANGNVRPGDGALFHGRGLVQLTWANNYKKMGKLLGMGDELYVKPDRAKEPAIAVPIMFEGMLRRESGFGDFTGAALEDFVNATKTDFYNARRVINGLDHAAEIAAVAQHFLDAIRAA